MARALSPTSRLLEQRPTTDGIFADNDMMAIGAMRELQTLGREAVRRLVALRDGDGDHREVVLPVSLTVRDSA